MPSSEKFRDHVLQQFKGELRVTTRKMMGEYILYADGKIFGGIYDDRLLRPWRCSLPQRSSCPTKEQNPCSA